tara:strand:+ start:12477 stop:13172 length:696 start_codon:yes stop_codon:yes gene_type:complete
MENKIQNWKKFNKNLILERSNLSEFFNREEVKNLHKTHHIPHDVEIVKVSIEELKSVNNRSNVLYRDTDNKIQKCLVKTILAGEKGNVSDIYLLKNSEYVSHKDRDPNTISSYNKMHKKLTDRSNNNHLSWTNDNYFYNYMENVVDKIIYMGIPYGKLGGEIRGLDKLAMAEENFEEFKYYDELVAFIKKQEKKEIFYTFYEDFMDTYPEINSYDEFNHKFSYYILKNDID